ncbi:MAG: protein kinase domain-containing protein [Nannocystaceae bacterium]|nr:protein kinase [bacterium]
MGGRYQVDRLIGRGGMGLVYLGRELLDDRELVLKMLAPHWADEPSAVGRFEREGQRLGELRHPNIVELFDIGHEDDHPYIVMEFIRGIPLRKVLKQKGRLTPAEFFPIAAQLLEAVAYAHSRGVMLRDIKPSNVMLCEQDGKANFVKVLDFGLAKMVDGDDVEITKSNVIGTAGFLAPELIRGGDIDVRVDVYALSIMFFIMLTGSSPIRGENDGAILYNHVHGTPRAFEDALPEGVDVPPGLRGLVYKAMSKEASDRHANAGEMLEELRGLVPAEAFELPSVSTDGKAEVDRYWERKYAGLGLNSDNPSSSLWTRPRLEKLLEGGAAEAEEVEPSNEDPYGTSPGAAGVATPDADLAANDSDAPRQLPPQPSAAIRAKTTARTKAAPTQMGLPPLGSDEPPLPPPTARRPKPARTIASSNMDRALPGPPPRRATLQAPSGSSGKPEPATPAPKDKPSITQSMVGSSATPTPVAAPSPLEGDNDVGPLHLELEVPPRRRGKARPPGSRSTLPMGSALEATPQAREEERPTDEIDVLDVEELDIELDEDEDDDVVVVGEPDPVTDPVAPVTRPAPELAAAPIMAEAEPAPAKRGIGMVLALSVGAALLLGGIVTWVALRSDGGSTSTSGSASSVAKADDVSTSEPSNAGAQAPAVAIDDDLEQAIDPDAPGTIRVEGPEGAEAFINDESVGKVPAKVTKAPGLYKIRVEATGYEDWSTEVQLQPDGHAKLVAANVAANVGKASGSARPGARRRPSGGKRPAPKSDLPPKSDPPDAQKADPPPKKNPPPEDDGVFMKSGKKKDDGIFLPVGK